MIKTRAAILREVVAVLRQSYPDGITPRGALLAETTRIGLSQPPPWLVTVSPRRGWYDLSGFFADVDREVGAQDSAVVEDSRTDADVDRDVSSRFATLDRVASGVASGIFRALIISGPPGVGKTWTVEEIISKASGIEYEKVSGYSRATGLFRALWEHKDPNHVVVIDDCDSVFQDENALNLLKVACETGTSDRVLAWRAETDFEDEVGEDIPRKFVFEGRVVFVTNLDFDALSRAGGRLAVHLSALCSRSLYLDLNMSRREVLSRVLSVARTSKILAAHNEKEKEKIVSYVRERASQMREVSLRALVKLSQILTATKSEADFVRIADATLTRR